MLSQGGEDALHWQPDDVAHRAFDALDQPTFIFLGGIAPGFVEGMNTLQVSIEVDIATRPKPDPGGFHKRAEFPLALLHEADAGQDLVDTAAELFQHGPRLGQMGRFPENTPIERNDCIRTQDDAPRKPRRNLSRLEACVQET